MIEATVAQLTPVPAAARRTLRDADGSAGRHADAVQRIEALHQVELAAPAAAAPLGEEVRVVAWNTERCCDPAAAARLLERSGAEVALLTEMDLGMARSGQRHTTRELAATLGWGYAFGVEFVELDLGSASERAAWAGHENHAGLHGCAIASGAPLQRPALVRLESRGDWFDGHRGERRVGGRVALVAQVGSGDERLTLAAVHLENFTDPADRAEQLAVLLRALERYDPEAPALIGGDLNTFSLAAADLLDPERVERALAEAPDRWTHPVPHEPLFEAAAAAGYAWRDCNDLSQGTHRHPRGTSSTRGPMHWDWFLSRGLVVSRPQVIEALDESGRALSDHEAIAVTVCRTARR